MRTNKERSNKLESTLTNVANLVGAPGIDGNGEPYGLNLLKEAQECREKAEQIHNGLFITQVMGSYNSGKSSIINALVKEQVLPSMIRPSTAILTILQYGDKNECNVHFKAKQTDKGEFVPGEIVNMSIEDFRTEYTYTEEDDEEYQKTGYVKRFADVDHAVVRVKNSLLLNSNRLLDCPGLRNNIVDDALAKEMAKKANAIIYVGTADKAGFDMEDKAYFDEHFVACPNNVFFIINKFDVCRTEYEKELVRSKVEHELSPYFTDNTGDVDMELMRRRIFYVSALYAIDSFEGQRIDEFGNVGKLLDHQCGALYEKSGFGNFVSELENYLNTDSRNMDVYTNSIQYMQDLQRKAQERVDEDKTIYTTKSCLSKEECEKIEDTMNSIELKISSTEKNINMWTIKFQEQFSNILRDSVQKIDDTWEIDILGIADKVNFRFGEFMRLAFKQMNFFKSKDRRSAEVDRMLAPFANAVAEHVSSVIAKNIKVNMPLIERAIKEAETEVGASVTDIRKMFDGLSEGILPKKSKTGTHDVSFAQQLVALYFGDLSEMVDNAGNGRKSWMEFIKKIFINSLWQWCVVIFAAGPLAPVLILAIEAWQIKKAKDSHAINALNNAKNSIMSTIRTNMEQVISEKNLLLLNNMEKVKETLCKESRMQLESEKARLCKIQHDMADMSFSYEAEMARCRQILERLQNEIQQASDYILEVSSC